VAKPYGRKRQTTSRLAIDEPLDSHVEKHTASQDAQAIDRFEAKNNQPQLPMPKEPTTVGS